MIRRETRRPTASLIVLLGSLWAAPVMAQRLPAGTRPNIVLLFIDDIGWNEMTYRENALSIPNIDALRSDGTTFSRAYAASPTCSPSRASVITGLHPARLHIVRHIPADTPDGRADEEFETYPKDPARMPSRNWLPPGVPTIANMLKPLGYHTAFVGKWHLGHEPYHPVRHGYDVQFGVSNFGHPESYVFPFFKQPSDTYNNLPEGKYLTEQLTDDAVGWLEKQDKNQPFMLTLFYYSAHQPYRPDPKVMERLKKQNPGRRITALTTMLASIDDSVGRIRETLERMGVADHTIIFLLGDQGGLGENAPIRGSKRGGQALYDGGARIPFTVIWPGVAKPAAENETVLVSTNDVLPTMFEMAGGEVSNLPQTDGRSLAPLLRGGAAPDRDAIVLYRSYEDQYAAVICGTWKYIAYRRGKAELYNLAEDIGEKHDLSKDDPERLAAMKATLTAWEKQMGVPGRIK